METIYEVTILCSLALMAIVIAVFVLASSLHGNAVRKSTEEEEALLARRRERLEELKKQLVGVMSSQSSDTTNVSASSIGKLAKDIDRIEKSISKARSQGRILTVNNIVIVPFCSLLAAIISSAMAIVTKGIVPNILLGLSLSLIGFSLYWIFRNLRFIEGFSTLTGSSVVSRQPSERIVDQPLEQPSLPLGQSAESSVSTMRDIIRANLDSMPRREARVLQFWYGMDSPRLSPKRIAHEWAVSGSKAKEIWSRGMRMNRHPIRSKPLERFVGNLPFLDERDPWETFVGDLFGV